MENNLFQCSFPTFFLSLISHNRKMLLSAGNHRWEKVQFFRASGKKEMFVKKRKNVVGESESDKKIEKGPKKKLKTTLKNDVTSFKVGKHAFVILIFVRLVG